MDWRWMYVDPPTRDVAQYFERKLQGPDSLWFLKYMGQFVTDVVPKHTTSQAALATWLGHIGFNLNQMSFMKAYQQFMNGIPNYDNSQNYIIYIYIIIDGYYVNTVLYINSLNPNPLFEYFCPHPELYASSEPLRSIICLFIQKLADEWMRMGRRLCKSMCKAYHFDGSQFRPSNLYTSLFLAERQKGSFKQVFKLFKRIRDGAAFETKALRVLQAYGRDLAKCFVTINPERIENLSGIDRDLTVGRFRKYGQRYFSLQSIEPVTAEVMAKVWPYLETCKLLQGSRDLESLQSQAWGTDLTEDQAEEWKRFIPKGGAVRPSFFPPPVVVTQPRRAKTPAAGRRQKRQSVAEKREEEIEQAIERFLRSYKQNN